jgi:iron complex outermembrane receptor protein
MKERLIRVLVITVFFLPLGVCAEKDQPTDASPATLPEVVVTGSRIEQQVRKIPANVSVITPADIQNTNAKTAADLLRGEEGIVVRDPLGNGNTAAVDLRGFGETATQNTLVLVDGRRVNEVDLSAVDWAQIPIEQIERIEIVRGSGTVLYGDNATAGVINIITKSPSQKFSANGGVTFGSYSRRKVDAYASGGYKRTAVSLSGSLEDTDGYRENNDYHSGNFGGKLIFDATDRLALNLSGSYHKDRFGLPGTLTQAEVDEDRRQSLDPEDRAKTRDSFITGGIDSDFGAYGQVLADLSYRERISESKFPDESFPFRNNVDTDTVGFTPRYIWDGEIFSRGNRLVAGVDLYGSKQDAKSYSGFFAPLPSSPTGLSNVDRNSYGFYFNDEFYVLKNLLFTFGARHEKVKYDFDVKDLSDFPLAPLDETTSDSENAFTAGLTLLYGQESSVFARVNRSFRFPLIDELVVLDFDTGQIVVNPELKPQTGRHYEFGVRHYFTPKIRANFTVFRADIDDEIFFNRPTFSNENYPETLHQGVEVGARADVINHVALIGNYSYEKATFGKGPFKNNDIPAVPNNRASLGLRIYDVPQGMEFSADYIYAGPSYAISDFENEFEKLDSYFTINMRLTYQWKVIRAFAGVNNLTNEKYSEFAVIGGFPTQTNFYPAPERNYVVGLSTVF